MKYTVNAGRERGNMKRANVLSFFALLVLMVMPGRAEAQDFLISQEDSLCGFAQSNPRLFPNGRKGFVVVWRDNRNGVEQCFGQEFDSTGATVGNNFRVFSDADVAFSRDGSFLSESEDAYSLDPYGYFSFYDLKGAVGKADGSWTQPVLFVSKQLPIDCVGCCIGVYHDLLPIPEGYLLAYNDGGLLSVSKRNSKLDTLWTWWNKKNQYSNTDSIMPASISIGVNGNGDFAVVWLNAPCREDTAHQVMGTFFDSRNNVLTENVMLKKVYSSTPDYCWWGKYRIRLAAVGDSLYEVFLLDESSSELSFWKIDRSGKPVDSGKEVILFNPPDYGPNSYFTSTGLSMTPIVGGRFSIMISGYMVVKSTFSSHDWVLTFDASGNRIGSVLGDSSQDVSVQKWFFRSGDSTIFVPAIRNGNIYLGAYSGFAPLWSSKVQDNPPGSNDFVSRVMPVDSTRFFVTWKDSRGIFGRMVWDNGAGPVSQLASDNFQFLADGRRLEVWSQRDEQNNYAFGYNIRDESWSIIGTDTLERVATPHYAGCISLVLPDTSFVVMFQPQWSQDVLWHVAKDGKAKRMVFDSDSSITMGLTAANDTSFWVFYSGHMRLLSGSLTALSDEYKAVNFSAYLGNGRFLTRSNVGGVDYGAVLSAAGDTLAGRFEIASGEDYLAVGAISDGYFLVLYCRGNRIFAKTYNADGVLRYGPVEVASDPNSVKLGPLWSSNGRKVLLSWTDARTPGKGYDVYGSLFDVAEITPVKPLHSTLPLNYALYQNYPNPFNPTTTISYGVRSKVRVVIVIYNVLGEKVATVVDGIRNPGTYLAVFNGSRFASGVYFCRMTAGEYASTRKLMILK